MKSVLRKKVYLLMALVLLIIVGCKKVDPVDPPLPDYSISVTDVAPLKVGDTYNITVSISHKDAKISTYAWSSSDTSVLTVNGIAGTQSATIKAVSAHPKNSAFIQVKTTDTEGNNKETKIEVATYNQAATITLSSEPVYTFVGDELTLKVTTTPEGTGNTPLSWSQSEGLASILDIDAKTGVITPKSAGIATISVKAEDGGSASDSRKLMVLDFPQELPTSADYVTEAGDMWIEIGKTITLPQVSEVGTGSTPAVWELAESGSNTATLDGGTLKGTNLGSTEISLAKSYTYEGTTYDFNASYNVYVTGLEVEGTESTIQKGGSTTFNAKFSTPVPSFTLDTISWKSSDTSVASVDKKTGKVTGLKEGTSTITATDSNTGMSASRDISVSPDGASSLVVTSKESSVPINDILALSVVVEPRDARIGVTWTVDPEDAGFMEDNTFVAGSTPQVVSLTATTTDGSISETLDIAVYDMKITGDTIIAGKGGSTTLTATVIPDHSLTEGVDTGSITWSIDVGESIATFEVDSDNPKSMVLTATPRVVRSIERSGGKVRVTARGSKGVSAFVDVYIDPVVVTGVTLLPPSNPPGGVEVDESAQEITVSVGSSFSFSTAFEPSNANNKGLDWSFEPEGVITLEGSNVKAIAPGTATVTATAKGAAAGETVSGTYTVHVRDFALSLEKEYLTVADEGVTLVGEMIPSERGTLQLGNWKSDTPGVVSVDTSTGELTPIKGGRATIFATDETTKLTRNHEVAVVTLAVFSAKETIKKGETSELTYELITAGTGVELADPTWSSSDETVATIDESGSTPQVVGVGVGSATITLLDESTGLSDTVQIEVTHLVSTHVTINEDTPTVTKGGELQFTATVEPNGFDSSNLFWELVEEAPAVEGETVATIDQDGLFMAKSAGTVTVKVTTKDTLEESNPISDTHTVVVQDFVVDPTSITLKKGDSQEITYTLLPEGSGTPEITLSDYDKSVIAIYNDTVTAKEGGTTTITVVDSVTGLSQSIEVNTWDIAIDGVPALAKGDSHQYKLVKLPSNEVIATDITWDIDNKEYAWVDADGKVTAEPQSESPATRISLATVTLQAEYEGLAAFHEIVINGSYATEISMASANPDSLPVGDSIQLQASVNSNATNQDILWSLAEGGEEFASINPVSGRLTGIKPGVVKVIATAKGSAPDSELSATAEITVLGVELTLPENLIKVGDVFTIGVTVLPTGANITAVPSEWESSDTTVATIGGLDGKIEALSPGTTIISGVEENTGIDFTYELSVYGLKVSGLPTVTAGSVSSYTVDLLPSPNAAGITLGDVSWEVTEGTIEAGEFTAPTTSGVVTITVKDTTNSLTGTLSVTVEEKKVDSILIKDDRDINVGDSLTLTAVLSPDYATNKEVKWTILNEDETEHDSSVLEKGENTTFTGVAPGTVTVMATALGSVNESDPATDSVTITVRDIEITLDQQEIFVGETTLIQGKLLPSGTAKVAWDTADSTVATAGGGVITGMQVGTTDITAVESVTGIEKSTPITVTGIAIEGDVTKLSKGESTTLRLMKVYEDASQNVQLTENIVWGANNPNIAWIDKSTGKITAEPQPVQGRSSVRGITSQEVEVTAIYVTAQGVSMNATYTVTIIPDFVTGMTITPEETVSVHVDDTVALSVIFEPENPSEQGVDWSIDPSQYAIAQIDSQGVVSGIAPGVVTVTATARGAEAGSTITATKEVTVHDLALTSPADYVVVGAEFTPVVHILPGTDTPAQMGDWTSSDSEVLSYDETTKKFIPKKGGIAVITGTDSITGLTRSFSINVVELKLTAPQTVEVGSTSSPLAVALVSGGSQITLGDITWTVEPEGFAEFVETTDQGKSVVRIKGVALGDVTVTATDSNGISGSAPVSITFVPVSSVSIEGDSKVSVEDSITLTPKVEPALATNKDLVWTIQNADGSAHDGSIATISSTGEVSGVGVGAITVVVTASGSQDAENPVVGKHTVTVRDIAVATDKEEIFVGQIAQIEASIQPAGSGTPNITQWTPSIEGVGSLTGGPASATLTGVSSGTLIITAEDSETGRSSEATITVSDIEIRVANDGNAALSIGEDVQLELYKIPAGEKIGSGVTWESLSSDVATVGRESGLVTASSSPAASGQSATIVAHYTEANLSTEFTITVDGVAVESITINDPVVFNVGSQVALTATVAPENASNKDIRWSISEEDASTVTLTSDGQLLSREPVAITVTATAKDGSGVSVEKEVVIRDFVITLPELVTIESEFTPTGSILPKNDTPTMKNWISSDKSVATIDETTGKVSTLKGGTTTITATDSVTGLTRSVDLYVAEIMISVEKDSIPQGESISVRYWLNKGNPNITLGSVTWEATPEGVITFDDSGSTLMVTGVQAGEVVLKATDSNGIIGYALPITVTSQPVESIILSGASYLDKSNTMTLQSQVLPQTAMNKELTWSVKNIDGTDHDGTVATIDSDGTITGIGQGAVLIQATAVGSADSTDPVVATHQITVRELALVAPSVINVSNTASSVKAVYLPEGSGTPKIESWSLTTESGEESIILSYVAGRANATLTAKDADTFTVAAKLAGSDTTVSTTIVAQKLIIVGDTEVAEGLTTPLVAKLAPTDEEVTVTWTSYNEDLAWVDNDGLVTASKKPEETPAVRLRSLPMVTIHAIHGETGLEATHRLSITNSPAEGVKIVTDGLEKNGKIVVWKGDSVSLNALVTPQYATDKTVTWSIEGDAATISETTGLLTGVAAGKVKVTATANGTTEGEVAPSDSIDVYIGELLISNEPRVWITDGGNFTSTSLSTKIEPVDLGFTPEVSWQSQNSDIIKVTPEGEVTAGTIPGTIALMGTDSVSGKTLTHFVSLVNVKIALDDWIATGQEKAVSMKVIPAELASQVALDISVTTPGSSEMLSLVEGADGAVSVKGVVRNNEGERAKVRVVDNTTGLIREKDIVVVQLNIKENATSWVSINSSNDLAGMVEILPKSASITTEDTWSLVEGEGMEVESDGRIMAGADYGKVSLRVKDAKTGHEFMYPLYMVDIALEEAPVSISSKSAGTTLKIVTRPEEAQVVPEGAWELVLGDAIQITENGNVTVTGESGTVRVRVDDATTGLSLSHEMEVVDFTIVPTAATAKQFLYKGVDMTLEASLSTDGDFPLNLTWSSIPEGYVSIEPASDTLSAKVIAGDAYYDNPKGIEIYAEDVDTGLFASYYIPIVGLQMKSDQPTWVRKGNDTVALYAEVLPAGVMRNPNFEWTLSKNPGATRVTGFGADTGKASLYGGGTAGYATVQVKETGTGLAVTHDISVVELQIEQGDSYMIPVTLDPEKPFTKTFTAKVYPEIEEASDIVWSVTPSPTGFAEGTTIGASDGTLASGDMFGYADVWAKDNTTKLAEKLSLTVLDFELSTPAAYVGGGSELGVDLRLRPAADYDLGSVEWSIVDSNGDPSSEFITFQGEPTLEGATVKANHTPGTAYIQATHPKSGVIATKEVSVAVISPNVNNLEWLPVTSRSNFKKLEAKILPESLVGEGRPIPYPKFKWEIVAENESDPDGYSGAATIVGAPADPKIKGDTYGKVRVKVTDPYTKLSSEYDLWVVQFFLQGEKPLYLTTPDGVSNSTTLQPVILPEAANVSPDLEWSDFTGDFAEFYEESMTVEGRIPNKSVSVNVKDNTTGETVGYSFAVVGFEVTQTGTTWIDHNIGEFPLPGDLSLKHQATLTGRFLPEGIDLDAIGLTPDLDWSGTSNLATVSNEADGSATVASAVVSPTDPKEDVTGDVVVTVKDNTTGISKEHKVVVGALELTGDDQVRKGEFSLFEVVRYPLEYGQFADSKWIAGNSNVSFGGTDISELGSTVQVVGAGFAEAIDVSTYDPTSPAAGIMLDEDTINAYDSAKSDEKWALPKNQVVAHDTHTGLIAQHGIGVGADYMEIEIDSRGTINIPVSNTNILVDWYNTDGLYTKGNGSVSSHPGGIVRITELSNIINLTDWHYNTSSGSNMRASLKDVRKWGDADFTGADNAFRSYAALKTFSATDGPILGGDLSNMFRDTTQFDGLGLQYWDVSEVTNMSSMFYNADGLTGLYPGEDENGNSVTKNVFSGWGVDNVTTTVDMFRNTNSYTGDYMSDLNWASLTTATGMFQGAAGLIGKEMNNWNMPKITSMQNFFRSSSNYTGEGSSDWNIIADTASAYNNVFASTSTVGKNLKNWRIVVKNSDNLGTVISNLFGDRRQHVTGEGMSGWTMESNGGNADRMFADFNSLVGTNMSNWTFPTITSAVKMFGASNYPNNYSGGISNLVGKGMTEWSFPELTDATGMFAGLANFDGDIDEWSMPKLKIASHMFQETSSFQGLGLATGTGLSTWNENFANITHGTNMFYRATAFTGEGISGLTFPELTSADDMFGGSARANRTFTGKDAKDWTFTKIGNGQTGVTTIAGLFNGTESSLTGEGMSGWEFTTATSAVRAFDDHDALIGTGMVEWNFPELTDATRMFQNTDKFNGQIALWNMPKLKIAERMFAGTASFTWQDLEITKDTPEGELTKGVEQWNKNFANLEDANHMFYNAAAFTGEGISGLKFPSLKNGRYMFYTSGFTGKNAKDWTFTKIGNGESGVSTIRELFYYSRSLTGEGMSGWEFTTATSAVSAFDNHDTLVGDGMVEWNFPELTDATRMFAAADNFNGQIALWNMPKLKTAVRMFQGTGAFTWRDLETMADTPEGELTEGVVQWNKNFANLEDANHMFYNATAFTGEGISGLQFPSLTSGANMFNGSGFTGKNAKNWTFTKIGNGESGVTSIADLFNGTESSLTGEGMSGWEFTTATSAASAFEGHNILVGDGMVEWNFPELISADSMFQGASMFNGQIALWNMPKLENAYEMFWNASAFTWRDLETTADTPEGELTEGVVQWNKNFANLTNSSRMFYSATAFTGEGISGLKFPELTSASDMFGGSAANRTFTGKNAKNWTFGKIGVPGATSLADLFNGTESSLTGEGMSGWEFTTATSARNAFYGHSALTGKDMSGWKFPKLTDAAYMFYDADALVGEGMSDWYVPELKDATRMFEGTDKFKGDYLYTWNFPKLEIAFGMMYRCAVLDPDISQWNMPSLRDTTGMFQQSPKFTGRGLDTEEGVAQWNKNLANVTIALRLFQLTAFTGENVSGLSFPNLTNGTNMFDRSGFTGKNAKNWTFGKIGVPGATSLADLFNGTESSLTGEGMSGWEFTTATSTASAFNGHTVLTGKGMAAWDFPKAVTLTEMFRGTSMFNGPVETWNMGKRGAQVTDADGNGITDGDDNPIYYQNFGGTDVNFMFYGSGIDRDLRTWDFSSATSVNANTFGNTPMAGDTNKLPVGF